MNETVNVYASFPVWLLAMEPKWKSVTSNLPNHLAYVGSSLNICYKYSPFSGKTEEYLFVSVKEKHENVNNIYEREKICEYIISLFIREYKKVFNLFRNENLQYLEIEIFP